jgi:mannose-6-phosphate isomerase-like protein (cupin superfamily)
LNGRAVEIATFLELSAAQRDETTGGIVLAEKVNLDQQFARFQEHWSPKIVAGLNDYDVKVVKILGEFVWHQHDDTDELFLVTAGRLRIRLEGQEDVVLGPGELVVVPRGVRHCPVADEETRLVLLEPRGTTNTGDADVPGTAGEPIA